MRSLSPLFAVLPVLEFAACGAIAPTPEELVFDPSSTDALEVLDDPWVGPITEENGRYHPDANAAYWVLDLSNNSEQPVAYRLRAQFAFARYQSLTLYDRNAGTYFAGLADSATLPDAGCVNPYLPGADRQAPNREYAVWIVPEGIGGGDNPNLLVMQAGVSEVALMLRVYLPDDPDDDEGGVALPEVTRFSLPSRVEPPMGGGQISAREPGGLPPANPPGEIHFWRAPGNEGAFGNPDNDYLVTLPNDRNSQGHLIAFRFRHPTFPDTRGGDPIGADDQVRYWSVCLGGAITTMVSGCLADEQFLPDGQGWVTAVVGPESPFLRWLAGVRGAAYLAWGPEVYPMLLYRNLMTNRNGGEPFAGDLALVPEHDQLPPEEGMAENWIGEYAPVGVQCPVESWISGDCW